jgi:hypothetical protein
MRRLFLLAVTACVVFLIGTRAFAQVTPNPDNPNDAIPDSLTWLCWVQERRGLASHGPPGLARGHRSQSVDEFLPALRE